MAYRSDESGEPQIYVRPYPNPKTGAQRLISDKRGEDPLWGSDGRELFYLTTEAAMAVPVDTGDTFQRGTPQRMFSMDPYYEGRGFSWDIHPDDRRFLLVKREQTDAAGSSQIVLVQNWHEELKRLSRSISHGARDRLPTRPLRGDRPHRRGRHGTGVSGH